MDWDRRPRRTEPTSRDSPVKCGSSLAQASVTADTESHQVTPASVLWLLGLHGRWSAFPGLSSFRSSSLSGNARTSAWRRLWTEGLQAAAQLWFLYCLCL